MFKNFEKAIETVRFPIQSDFGESTNLTLKLAFQCKCWWLWNRKRSLKLRALHAVLLIAFPHTTSNFCLRRSLLLNQCSNSRCLPFSIISSTWISDSSTCWIMLWGRLQFQNNERKEYRCLSAEKNSHFCKPSEIRKRWIVNSTTVQEMRLKVGFSNLVIPFHHKSKTLKERLILEKCIYNF